MIAVVQALQALNALSWAVPMMLFYRSFWRVMRRTAVAGDSVKSAVFVASASIIFFPVRWLIYSDEIRSMNADMFPSWVALYFLSAFAGQYLTWSVWGSRNGGAS